MNKTAFVISIVLTTFVLMSVGGVVYALRAPEVAPVAESAAEGPAVVDPALGPSLEQTLLEREAIYQQRIAEANARLEQAQQQLATQSPLADPQAGSLAAGVQITAEQAAQIAADFFGQSSVAWVEIVTVKGEDMFLVTFATGEMVYINMSGQVVGSAPAQFSLGSSSGGGHNPGSAGSSGSEQSEDSDDHDDDHEDEHEDGDNEHEDD